MADIKFSDLTGASIAADGSDILAISQAQGGGGYLSKRTTVGDVGRHAVTVQRYSALGGLTPVEAINEAMDSGITNNVKITMTKAIDAYSFDFEISNPDDSTDVYFSQTYECGLFGDFQPITATFSVGGNQYALSITCNPQGQSSPLFATLVVGGKSFTINAEGSNASYPVNFLQVTTLSIITADDIPYSSGVSVADVLDIQTNTSVSSASFTANSSSAANTVLSDDINLVKGLYLISIAIPVMSVSTFSVQVVGTNITKYGSLYPKMREQTTMTFLLSVNGATDTICIKSAESTAVTFTYLDRGGLFAYRLA